MANKSDPIENMSFEEAQLALTKIISKLEEDQVNLEESVALFERGKALLDRCQSLLDSAELKVRQLEEDGRAVPMDA